MSPLSVPTGKLSIEALLLFSFFPFRMQKTRVRSAKTPTNEAPTIMPIIGPFPKLSLLSSPLLVDRLSEPCGVCAPDLEWLLSLRVLPGGGDVYGGGGGAGPFANEFPSYLFYCKSFKRYVQHLNFEKIQICKDDKQLT